VAITIPSAGLTTAATFPLVQTNVPAGGPAPDSPTPPTTLTVPDDTALIYRVSEVYPAPSFTDGQLTAEWKPTSITRSAWGVFKVVIDGDDISEFRGGLVQIESYSYAEPFGDGPARISFSAIVPQESIASGDPSFVQVGNAIDIMRVDSEGDTHLLWSGEVLGYDVSHDGDSWTWSVDATGVMWLADFQVHKPPTMLDPTDIGSLIPAELNRVVGRRYGRIATVSTGILTTQKGSSDSSRLSRAAELLSTATTSTGTNQWTINSTGSRRGYSMRLKDRTTVDWTMRTGQPGCDPQLTLDATQAPNAIYGTGIAPNGYGWGNWFYPLADNSPYKVYPLDTSPLGLIDVGTSDGDTIGGHGVSDLQRRVNETGIARVTVDGVYNTSDANAIEIVQRHYGILVDGIVGPQTWAALFPQYASNALAGAFRLPIAFNRAIMPRLYRADGSDAGANSYYDASVLRVETDVAYGAGVTKAQAVKFAKAQLARDYPAGWTGSITLTMDPNEGSMYDIRAGHNFKLKGWAGSDLLLHISGVEVSPENETVTLTVDSKARDLATLNQILQRNRDNATNPLRLPSRLSRKSRLIADTNVPYDGESAGGIIKKTALITGLWVYVDVPVSEIGRVAKLELQTDPAMKFSVAFFGNLRVTANQMASRVGNPLTFSSAYGPYDRLNELYPEMGFIEAFGGPGQAAGYGSGYETSPYGGSTTITGTLKNFSGWDYQSSQPPFLRVFFWATENGSIDGRLYPAPLEL
jgi:peptidoglycan hydrolase-like protein with peptidoglycan-binding domain